MEIVEDFTIHVLDVLGRDRRNLIFKKYFAIVRFSELPVKLLKASSYVRFMEFYV